MPPALILRRTSNIAFTADGHEIATGGEADGTVRRWEPAALLRLVGNLIGLELERSRAPERATEAAVGDFLSDVLCRRLTDRDNHGATSNQATATINVGNISALTDRVADVRDEVRERLAFSREGAANALMLARHGGLVSQGYRALVRDKYAAAIHAGERVWREVSGAAADD